jgi:hypothetical protein
MSLVTRGVRVPLIAITPLIPFDITQLLNLQKELQNLVMLSPLPPIIKKSNESNSSAKIRLAIRSAYDLSNLPKNKPKPRTEDKLATSSSTTLSKLLQTT